MQRLSHRKTDACSRAFPSGEMADEDGKKEEGRGRGKWQVVVRHAREIRVQRLTDAHVPSVVVHKQKGFDRGGGGWFTDSRSLAAFAAKAGIIQSVSAEGCASCRLYRVRVPGTFVNSAEHRNDGMQRREEYNIIDSL